MLVALCILLLPEFCEVSVWACGFHGLGCVGLTNEGHVVCSVRCSEVDFAAADAIADLLGGKSWL